MLERVLEKQERHINKLHKMNDRLLKRMKEQEEHINILKENEINLDKGMKLLAESSWGFDHDREFPTAALACRLLNTTDLCTPKKRPAFALPDTKLRNADQHDARHPPFTNTLDEHCDHEKSGSTRKGKEKPKTTSIRMQ